MRRVILLVACLFCTACSKPDPHADLRKLTEFHRRLIGIDRQVAAAGDAYTSASSAALNAHDNHALFTAASALRGVMGRLAPVAARMDVPDLANGDAESHARNAAGSLAAEIGARENVADAVKAISDPAKPQPGAISAVAAAGDQANAAAIAQGSEMVLAYGALGITPDRIDSRNGGVK